MKVNIIVAHDQNRAIGKDNAMPWYLSKDFRRFKKITMGCPIIMGRKTFESIGKPLPGRENIVLTRNADYTAAGIRLFNDFGKMLSTLNTEKNAQCFVIGGEKIFEMALPETDKLFITEVKTKIPKADAFFPAYDPSDWKEAYRESHTKDERNDHDFDFVEYEQ